MGEVIRRRHVVRSRRSVATALLALAALAAVGALARPQAAGAGAPSGTAMSHERRAISIVELNGLVDPVMTDFVERAIADANRTHAEALVIQLDSPGVVAGRERYSRLIRSIRVSQVGIVVWVGPSGAEARGRVAELLRAAHAVYRAPGASVQADAFLPPIPVAPTLGDVIVQLDGTRLRPGAEPLRTARVVAGGSEPRREPTVAVRFAKPSLLARLWHTAASPSVAYLLLVLGLLLVVFEFFTAGVGVAAAVAAGCLVLAGSGLAVLPTSPLGLGLIALAFVGFGVDIQAGAPRAWTLIGTLALVVGSVRLFSGVPVPLAAAAVGVTGVLLAVVAGMPAMVRARFSTPTIGRGGLLGELGRASAPLSPDGTVEVRGAPWRARTNRATPIAAGDPVRVVGIDGLVLEVEPLEGAARDAGH